MGSWAVKEREAQMTGLLREAERQTRMDRVDPRGQLEEQMQLVEQDAEAQRSMKDRRKAGNMMDLWNRNPRKGQDSDIARERWTARLRGSPSGAEGRQAELLSRQPEIQTGRIRERMTSLAKVQLQVL